MVLAYSDNHRNLVMMEWKKNECPSRSFVPGQRSTLGGAEVTHPVILTLDPLIQLYMVRRRRSPLREGDPMTRASWRPVLVTVLAVVPMIAGCVGMPSADEPGGGALLTLGEPVELTELGLYNDPAWSPDGSTISFSGPGHRGLHTTPSSGGETDELVPAAVLSGFRHRWLDRPQRIVCPARGRHTAVEVSVAARTTRSVFLIDAVDPLYLHDEQIWVRGEVEDIRLSGDEDRFFELLTAPGGGHVAVVGLTTGIHVIEADTGITLAVYTGTHPAWTPAGRHLLFERTTDDGHQLTGGDLWAWSVDSGAATRLTDTPATIETHPSVAPDGRSVAFVRDGSIWVAALDEVAP
jgi:hypothetical protein